MSAKETKENIFAFGHENIQAVHPSTLMFTKERHLSKTGDCIVAVAADKSAADLSQTFKEALRKPNAKLTIIIEVDGLTEQINASWLTKTDFNSPNRHCDKKKRISSQTERWQSALTNHQKICQENLVEKLKNPRQKINITLVVHT